MKKFLTFFAAILLFQISAKAQVLSKPETKKFTQEDKEFNDWYVSAFAGGNLLQNTDLVSWGLGRFTPGYDLQLQVTKQITHVFGTSFLFQTGKTKQYGEGPHIDYTGHWEGKTSYSGLSLLGDLNLSLLFRRMDNNAPFRWAAHVYGGFGLIAYKTQRHSVGGPYDDWAVIDEVKFSDRAFFGQLGLGLRYKLNQKVDLELKGTYFMSGDEEFDASGEPIPGTFTVADFEEGRDDNMIIFSIGVHYKLGKHEESLQWKDPLKTIAVGGEVSIMPCVDDDNDGVCNAQDKCPDTPTDVKVDGAGCPLDADNDGVYDSIDECPTIPGPPTNNGCPIDVVEISIGTIAENLTDLMEDLQFDYNSAKIRDVSYPKLNAAFDVLEDHPEYKFIVEGHTDAAGSNQYNLELSQKRAESVIRYLINKGLSPDQLIPVGKGESDLKYPECNPVSNCPPWKNLANRRVVFKAVNP
jgi:OOP family OmpA-OmpF porin